jgi:hypothetical protein
MGLKELIFHERPKPDRYVLSLQHVLLLYKRHPVWRA